MSKNASHRHAVPLRRARARAHGAASPSARALYIRTNLRMISMQAGSCHRHSGSVRETIAPMVCASRSRRRRLVRGQTSLTHGRLPMKTNLLVWVVPLRAWPEGCRVMFSWPLPGRPVARRYSNYSLGRDVGDQGRAWCSGAHEARRADESRVRRGRRRRRSVARANGVMTTR